MEGNPIKKILPVLCLLSLLALLISGCGDSGDSSASDGSCERGELATERPGVLTIATSEPTARPYFVDDDPTNGEGFESAVAYAIAERLGYPAAKVRWTVEPARSLLAPGQKDFDFAVGQIRVSAAHEKTVDLSAPYYAAPQAVVALKKEDWVEPDFVLSMEIVKNGVQQGTSSARALRERISPREKPVIYDRFDELVAGLTQGQVEAIIVELPTALEIVAGLPQAHTVAQFSPPTGERWAAVLEKGSDLTPCVSEAIEQLRADGELEKIATRWMSQAVRVPILP